MVIIAVRAITGMVVSYVNTITEQNGPSDKAFDIIPAMPGSKPGRNTDYPD
jgi:hypothetical protein